MNENEEVIEETEESSEVEPEAEEITDDESTDSESESDGDDANADPFADLYNDEDEEEGDEELDPDDSDESDDDGEDAASDDDGDNGAEQDSDGDELQGLVKSLLKEAGYNIDGDIKATLKLAISEAKGESRTEFERRTAFEKQAAEDLKAIHDAYPETRKYKSLGELPNVSKFAHLMDDKVLNMTAVQAFETANPEIRAAKSAKAQHAARIVGTKEHLKSVVPKAARDTGVNMTGSQMKEYRDMFPDLSDKEIRALYKKATN